ncbi:neoverrucotoxin subunit alpha-like [Gambusia affinis]|uniref:neoverrucotoxin subunit alpha-like n=1 Tax=Gambusia affinis TaxID=33528 RepID=UPI001CDC772B|nr:neoverrucotoxin subunit alpha-like [Gambusia affinis]XP_043952549.1 neoverrucotoxin subunit alpha-like [Gambusia affinis]XP_043952550.1 neoverrucotoxin subunit alpha-like [Gambusia affinis]XP_043952551.1 neoverrucotoxin subunit alpha-like [Gambusia affinis]
MDSGVLELAALGRPFTLGTLYNHYNDTIVTEMSPWDQDDLTKHIQIRPHKHTDLDLVLSDSLEEKTSALSLNLSIKASILFGLIKYEGAAAYLDDNKTSKSRARVTINYKATTHVKELSMYHLRNLRYPTVIDKVSATHVVTGILYGAQVFFVFDRDVSEGENHQEVHGNMTMVVNKMSQMAGEMKGDVIIDPKVQDAEKYKCTFHGDVCPNKKPTNFQEAIEIYKSLPELLKDGEKAVPIKVFMLPLTSFGTTASKLVRQISVGLVLEVQRVLEDFIELDVRCNDVLGTTIVKQFPDISSKIKKFKSLLSCLKSELKEDLEKKLSIRAKEAQLAEILKKKRSSFRNSDLKWWLDCKEKEVNTIKSITEKMKNPNIIPSLNGDHETGADEVYYFVFTSLGRDEPLLSALSAYLKGTKEDNQNQDLHDVEREQWYASKEKLRDIRKKAKAFSDFAEDNKDNQKMKFLVVGLTDDKYEGSTIYLYKNGTIVNKNYELPSKPETPKLQLHTSVSS